MKRREFLGTVAAGMVVAGALEASEASLLVPDSPRQQMTLQCLEQLAQHGRFDLIGEETMQAPLHMLYRGSHRDRVRADFQKTVDSFGNDIALLLIRGVGIAPGFLLIRRPNPVSWKRDRYRRWEWRGQEWVRAAEMQFFRDGSLERSLDARLKGRLA